MKVSIPFSINEVYERFPKVWAYAVKEMYALSLAFPSAEVPKLFQEKLIEIWRNHCEGELCYKNGHLVSIEFDSPESLLLHILKTSQ